MTTPNNAEKIEINMMVKIHFQWVGITYHVSNIVPKIFPMVHRDTSQNNQGKYHNMSKLKLKK